MRKRIGSIAIVVLMLTMMTTSIFAGSVSISSPSGILMDSKTGEILYEKNVDTQRAIASTTKIMTYLLVMEAIDEGKIKMNDIVTISKTAGNTGGSNYKLKVGDKVSVRELLDSMMIISANDSAVALGEYVSGSVPQFANLMNSKAKELGLDKAHFINPNGLPLSNNDQNKTTTRDLAKIADFTLKKYEDDLTSTTKSHYFVGKYKTFNQRNTNRLVRSSQIVDGLKTGYTNLAGHCLVSTYKHPDNPDHRIISVVLGGKSSDQRFDDSVKLIEYGIQDHNKINIIKAGDMLLKDTINFGGKDIPVELVAVNDLTKFTLKNVKLDTLLADSISKDVTAEDIINGKEIKVTVKLSDGSSEDILLKARKGISVFLNDSQIDFKGVEPIVKGDRTLIPIRALTENMGFEVAWDGEDQSVRITKDGNLIELNIGSNIVKKNGQLIELDTSAELIDSTTFVPLRFISESLNQQVDWIGDSRQIIIKNM